MAAVGDILRYIENVINWDVSRRWHILFDILQHVSSCVTTCLSTIHIPKWLDIPRFFVFEESSSYLWNHRGSVRNMNMFLCSLCSTYCLWSYDLLQPCVVSNYFSEPSHAYGKHMGFVYTFMYNLFLLFSFGNSQNRVYVNVYYISLGKILDST